MNKSFSVPQGATGKTVCSQRGVWSEDCRAWTGEQWKKQERWEGKPKRRECRKSYVTFYSIDKTLTESVTHTHPFNGPLSETIQVSRYQKGKTNVDFTEARDSEWQWHQLGHMQVCTSLQTDNHASTPPLSFLQARCPSCCLTNSVKALKALNL